MTSVCACTSRRACALRRARACLSFWQTGIWRTGAYGKLTMINQRWRIGIWQTGIYIQLYWVNTILLYVSTYKACSYTLSGIVYMYIFTELKLVFIFSQAIQIQRSSAPALDVSLKSSRQKASIT